MVVPLTDFAIWLLKFSRMDTSEEKKVFLTLYNDKWISLNSKIVNYMLISVEIQPDT